MFNGGHDNWANGTSIGLNERMQTSRAQIPPMLDASTLDPIRQVTEPMCPIEAQPPILRLHQIVQFKDAAQHRGWHHVEGPKSWVHTPAFTAASLLSRLTELVDEFDTLHSIGMMRRSQSPTVKSAFLSPSMTSWQN